MEVKEGILHEVCLRKRDVTAELMLRWVDVVSNLILPDSMCIKTVADNHFVNYDAEQLKEEIESEELQKDIYIKLYVADQHFTVREKKENDRVIFSLDILKENYDQKLERMIEEVMCKGYGISASMCSSRDNFLQSIEDMNWYRYYGLSLENVKTTFSKVGLKEEIVDIEYNPGHHHLEEGIRFASDFYMWFGKDFYQYISKERLKAFSNCYENIELENDVIRIKLYEDMWEYDNSVNRKRQWDFRKSVGIDEVAHVLYDKKMKRIKG